MSVDVPIPHDAQAIIRAIRIHPDGSVAIHYAQPVAIGGVMADGRTFLGGPFVGPFEIRVEHVLLIEANRRARRLGRLEQYAVRELPVAPPAPLPAARALPPVPGYRDPRPAPAPLQPVVADLPALPADDEDGTVIRGRMLELDLPPLAPALCGSCGMADGQHARDCRRCPDCGAGDQDACTCP